MPDCAWPGPILPQHCIARSYVPERSMYLSCNTRVQLLQDVRAHAGLAIHHATFCLTDEPLDEPAAK